MHGCEHVWSRAVRRCAVPRALSRCVRDDMHVMSCHVILYARPSVSVSACLAANGNFRETALVVSVSQGKAGFFI